MKRRITYKQRLIYVFIVSFLFAIVLYKVALADTLAIAIENNKMEEQVSNNIDAPKQIQFIKNKLTKIDQLIGNNVEEEQNNHQALLEQMTNYFNQNSIVLKDFPEPYVSSSNGYITKTSKATVEGDFIQLLKLLYLLEQNYHVGKVVAVDFNIHKELRTRKRMLHSTIYIQDVKTEDYEENS